MPASPRFRLALATSVPVPGIHSDDAHFAACLRARDVEPVACVWNDPAVDWSGFDAVLVRTTWDYFWNRGQVHFFEPESEPRAAVAPEGTPREAGCKGQTMHSAHDFYRRRNMLVRHPPSAVDLA